MANGRPGRKPRPILIVGDVAHVPLTQGLEALIDAADVPLIDGWSWTPQRNGRTIYAYRAAWDPATKRQRRVWMHRLITEAPEGLVVDHINGGGLDNRRVNLRVVTAKVNHNNRFYHREPFAEAPSPGSSTGFRGVYRVGTGFTARVAVGRRQMDVARGDDAAAVSDIRVWYFKRLRAPLPSDATAVAEAVREVAERDDIAPGAAMALIRHLVQLPHRTESVIS